MAAIVTGISHNADAVGQNCINDAHFIQELRRLKELRSFLIHEAISVSTADSIPVSLGRLNQLQYGSGGRAPTPEEWAEVELHTQTLFGRLNEPLRKRFMLGQIPTWMAALALILAVIAVAALIGSAVTFHLTINSATVGIDTLPWYLAWLMCLGALGSVAYIGMNALSVQEDITFDLTNRRLMLLRITLGALFGLVLTLPFGFAQFIEFIRFILNGPPEGGVDAGKLTVQAVLLLLPFILGFSTSLVIMALNRLMDAVQAFFGRSDAGVRTESSSRSSHVGH